ncbi:MAG: hypothetical protein ACRC0X_09775 [Brevinema sp.]
MTIREIASITNISFSTVYRALKNPEKAKPEILQKINSVIESVPNIHTLKQVYIIIPFINEFYTHFVLHVTTLLSKQGIIVIPFIYNEDNIQERNFISSLTLSSRIGLIWVPTGNRTDYPFLSRKKNRVPIVSLLRKIDNYSMDIQIFQDNQQAIELSLKSLISKGKTNILMINGQSSLTTAHLRNIYFIQCLQSYSNITGTIIEAGYQDWKHSYNLLIQQYQTLHEFDAFITTSENLCYGTLKALQSQNIYNKPIICFDHTAGLEALGISMIYFSPQQIAEKAVEFLFEKVKNSNFSIHYMVDPIIHDN